MSHSPSGASKETSFATFSQLTVCRKLPSRWSGPTASRPRLVTVFSVRGELPPARPVHKTFSWAACGANGTRECLDHRAFVDPRHPDRRALHRWATQAHRPCGGKFGFFGHLQSATQRLPPLPTDSESGGRRDWPWRLDAMLDQLASRVPIPRPSGFHSQTQNGRCCISCRDRGTFGRGPPSAEASAGSPEALIIFESVPNRRG